jgi:hypothetical protein
MPSWAEPDYIEHNVVEFKLKLTGFHVGLNYYRAAEPHFYLSAAFKGAKVTQPSFLMMGKTDELKQLYSLTKNNWALAFPDLWNIWSSTMLATGSNTKPLPRLATSS